MQKSEIHLFKKVYNNSKLLMPFKFHLHINGIIDPLKLHITNINKFIYLKNAVELCDNFSAK